MSIISPKYEKVKNHVSPQALKSFQLSADKIPKTGSSNYPPLFQGNNNYGYKNLLHSLTQRIMLHQMPNQVRWKNAATDAAFRNGSFAGNYGTENTTVTTRARFSISQIDVICGSVSGYQTENRKTYRLDPLLPKYAKAAEQHNKIQTYLIQRRAILDKISTCFNACINEGSCIGEPSISTANDRFDLNMKIWRYCDYIIDANYREPDGSDCTYMATSEFLEVDETEFYYPWIPSHVRQGGGAQFSVAPFYFQPQMVNGQSWRFNHIVKLWQRKPVKKGYWIGEVTGRRIPMEREDVFISIEDQESWREEYHDVHGWYRDTYCNGTLVAREESPYGETTPFTLFYWKFNNHLVAIDQRIMSLVRQLEQGQYLSDLFLNLSLDALYSRANGGIMYKEGSITDTKALTDPDNVRNLCWKGDTPPSFIASNVIPEQNILMGQQILSMIRSASPINLPVNPEPNNTDSGLKTMLQQGAQLVGLSSYMAQLDRSTKHWGRLCLYSVLNHMPMEMAEEIVGEPLDPFFWSVSEENCELTPALGILTDTQAKETYVQYMEMFRETGIQPTLEVLKELATTPEKEKIFGMLIEARDAQIKAASAQAEIQEELAKATVAKTNAEAISQLSRAKEAEGRASSYAGLHAEHAIQRKKGNADATLAYSNATKNIAEMLETFGKSSIDQATKVVESIAMLDDSESMESDMDTLDNELVKTTSLFEGINNQTGQENQEEQNAYQES